MARNKKPTTSRTSKPAKRKAMPDIVTTPIDDGEDFTLETQDAPKGEPSKSPARAGARSTAPSGKKSGQPEVLSYRHSDKRRNNPEVGMVRPENDPDDHEERWCYDPHIDPALQFDFGRAQVEKLIDEALASGDQDTMRAALEELKRYSAPYLNWTGKAERTTFDVNAVCLHVHFLSPVWTTALPNQVKNWLPIAGMVNCH